MTELTFHPGQENNRPDRWEGEDREWGRWAEVGGLPWDEGSPAQEERQSGAWPVPVSSLELPARTEGVLAFVILQGGVQVRGLSYATPPAAPHS